MAVRKYRAKNDFTIQLNIPRNSQMLKLNNANFETVLTVLIGSIELIVDSAKLSHWQASSSTE